MRTDYLIGGIVCTVLAALAFWGMWSAWRKRSRRASSIGELANTPVGELVQSFERVLYTATNPLGRPLERVNFHGLAYRGYATVAVYSGGLLVSVAGESAVFLPVSDVYTTNVRAGKAVESGGLTIAVWELAGEQFESGFRFVEAAEQQDFIRVIEAQTLREGRVNA